MLSGKGPSRIINVTFCLLKADKWVGGSVAKTLIADNFYISVFSAFFSASQNTKIADNLGVGGWVRPCLLLADKMEH